MHFYPVVAFMQAVWRDGWNGHDIGRHKLVRNHPEEVIAMLTKAGCSFREHIKTLYIVAS